MRFNVALLVLLLLALFMLSAPSAARCSCGTGASAGFNFLGDPSFNVDMTSFDDFSQEYYLANKIEESVSDNTDRAKRAGVKESENNNNLSLDLDDGSHVDLILFSAGNDLFGRGDMALGNASEALGVVGTREGNRVILELVSLSEEPYLYRFDLQEDENSFLGDYVKIAPEGKAMAIRGTARGVLPKKVVVIG
ncbi:MAG TPA: hypothetical protein VLB04_11275 [Methanotrichaceae archaeon]|nr:hypothetical protein [Methanotrichaceae archaeon]